MAFSVTEKKTLKSVVEQSSRRLQTDVLAPLNKQIGSAANTALADVLGRLSRLINFFAGVYGDHIEIDLELLKAVILAERLQLANLISSQQQKVSNAQISSSLQQELDSFDSMMQSAWFVDTVPERLPCLTDFLTIECAELLLTNKTASDRIFDEKFHILQSPALFNPDLTRWRELCGIRALPISVAFIDIDDFKKFNSDFGYPSVDLHLLPKFMSLLEAHVFGRGSAYRYGGDEYVVILPNASCNESVAILQAFQTKLLNLRLHTLFTRRPTVSIGIYEFDFVCPYTNTEVFANAERAKDDVKQKKKGAIGYYSNHQKSISLSSVKEEVY